MLRQITSKSHRLDILVKLIPTEIIGAFVALQGIAFKVADKRGFQIFCISFVVMFVAIPFYLRSFYKVLNGKQITCTMISFVVWAYCVAGPLRDTKFYDPGAASAALILWGLIMPLVMKRKGEMILTGDWVKTIGKRPPPLSVPQGIFEWNDRMSSHLGTTAQVTSVNRKQGFAFLDVDKGENKWPFQWLALTQK